MSETNQPTTPIPRLEEFITCFVQKKELWTKTVVAHKLFHHTFVALSKTSPEIFETAWTKKGDLLPSTAGSLWVASNTVLGCSWSLITPGKLTILKNNLRDKKNLKSKGKSLTFDPECVTTKTKVGHFLTGMVLRQPFAKRQKVSKQFLREFQTFIELTICANMFGIQRNTHFLSEFRKLLLALMELEPRLVILPYPDRSTTATSRPFSNDCSMLSSLARARLYVDNIWVREGEPTRVKIIVSHNLKAAASSSIEFVKVANNLKGAVSICVIQASKVIIAGYLMVSRKTMVDIYWNSHFNNHPKLNNMDV